MALKDFFFSREPNCRKMSEEQLRQWLSKGGLSGRKAENCFFERFFDTVAKKARQHPILEEEEVLTAYAEALLAFYQQLAQDKFKGKSALKTYFISIFEFKCIDIIRTKTTNKEESRDELPAAIDGEASHEDISADTFSLPLPEEQWMRTLADPDANAEQEWIEREWQEEKDAGQKRQRKLLLQAMERLEPSKRALLMDYNQGFDPEELAEIHGLKSGRVASTLVNRYKGELMDILKDLFNEPTMKRHG